VPDGGDLSARGMNSGDISRASSASRIRPGETADAAKARHKDKRAPIHVTSRSIGSNASVAGHRSNMSLSPSSANHFDPSPTPPGDATSPNAPHGSGHPATSPGSSPSGSRSVSPRPRSDTVDDDDGPPRPQLTLKLPGNRFNDNDNNNNDDEKNDDDDDHRPHPLRHLALRAPVEMDDSDAIRRNAARAVYAAKQGPAALNLSDDALDLRNSWEITADGKLKAGGIELDAHGYRVVSETKTASEEDDFCKRRFFIDYLCGFYPN
jgi:hypothetical protein